jgi:L-lactate dehydrogenase
MHGEFGISDISLSMPAIVGVHGVENQIPIALDEEETDKLKSSAGTLKKIVEEVL